MTKEFGGGGGVRGAAARVSASTPPSSSPSDPPAPIPATFAAEPHPRSPAALAFARRTDAVISSSTCRAAVGVSREMDAEEVHDWF